MNKLKIAIISLIALAGFAVLTPQYSAYAASEAAVKAQEGVTQVGGGGAPTLEVTAQNVVNILLYIIGILSVIMIIFGGIRYVTSAGDSSRTKAAKDTIMYAVVGLIVALVAYAIVNFVLTQF